MATYLPSAFMDSVSKLDQFDPVSFRAVHDSGEQLVSVHMNPGKPIYENGRWNDPVSEPPFQIAGSVPWAPDAFYLSARPSFTLDPFFHAGNYYVQEASGMFVAHALKKILDLTRPLKLLDLCAAPGGKSTLMQSLISPESLLVTNEVIKTRVPVLYQNITKWGYSNGMVSSNDPSHFKRLPGFFDLLLIDAPCSGSGLFRKDPQAAATWSPDLVNLCSQRQQRILADAWDCLKDDGFLIYSTCSYSKEENEDILDHLLSQYSCVSIPLSPPSSWGIVESLSDEAQAFGYRFYPDKISGEGFFLAVLQKKQSTGRSPAAKAARNHFRITQTVKIQLDEWMETTAGSWVMVGDTVHLLPAALETDFEILRNTLYLKKAGIRIGKAGDKEWIPDHELSLANVLKKDAAFLDLQKAEATLFLKGEPFGTDIREKGWRVVRFGEQSLGWVKLLGNRMNNYYPKSWRIRQ